MYIQPNSTIKLLKSVPLDNLYNNTLYFESAGSQSDYFSSVAFKTFVHNTYQRVNKNTVRLEISADLIYDCNYMMFQNTNYGNKWFYSFVNQVNYINDSVAEIEYEIDEMQTWFFEAQLRDCFVEREHSLTDKIGENILPENVELGEYVYSDYSTIGNFADLLVIIMIAESDDTIGEVYEGIYGGCDMWAYSSLDSVSITAKIQEYLVHPEAIIGMYMCPRFLLPTVPYVGGEHIGYSQTSVTNYVSLNEITGNESFGGYIPKNKKLYTYPYNYLSIDNASGSSLPLRYEFFKDLKPVIEIAGTFLMPVKVVARPCNYKGLPDYTELGGYTASKTECITLENYPMCSWNIDTYKSWLVQNSVPIVMNTVSTLASGYQSTPTPSGITDLLTTWYKASIQADQCRGNVSNGNINITKGYQRLYKTRTHLSKNYAISIDNYFTKYGYATRMIKIPNRHSRPHWNYVKTNNCNIVGNLPSDSLAKLIEIYDNGITFWKHANEVGQYSLDNSPETGGSDN